MPVDEFQITATPPTDIALKPDDTGTFASGTFTFEVTCLTGPQIVHEVLFRAQLVRDGKGEGASWLSPVPQAMTMSGGETATVRITAQPDATTPGGAHKIRLAIASKAAPDTLLADSPLVTCELAVKQPDPRPVEPRKQHWILGRERWWWILVGVVVLAGLVGVIAAQSADEDEEALITVVVILSTLIVLGLMVGIRALVRGVRALWRFVRRRRKP
jgi:hypothetical protein